jgi:periplasmic protein TonB
MATQQINTLSAGGAGTDRFIAAMLDMSPTENKRRSPGRLVISVLVHALLIGAVILAPIYFADNSIDLKAMTTTFLVAPRPPAPPPPPAAVIQKVVHVTKAFQATPLVAPRAIPKTVVVVADAAPPSLEAAGGTIGGIPGGDVGGVLGGVLGNAAPAPPPPAAAPRQQVVRVGGDVKPPQLLSRVQPVYPVIARTAKVEGDVVVDAIIDEHGNVVKAHAVSGPGLLLTAALSAVQQWKYAPTYLNGVPVSIAMNVTVQFHLRPTEGD